MPKGRRKKKRIEFKQDGKSKKQKYEVFFQDKMSFFPIY